MTTNPYFFITSHFLFSHWGKANAEMALLHGLIYLFKRGFLINHYEREEPEVHTSSDVVEAVLAAFTNSWVPSTSLMVSALDSEPVGRPRSCRAC